MADSGNSVDASVQVAASQPAWMEAEMERGDVYCSIAYGNARLNPLTILYPHSQVGFTLEDVFGKAHWLATEAGALLEFDCRTFMPQLPSDAALPVSHISVSYIKSWNPVMGSALLWAAGNVSLVVQDAAGLNRTVPLGTVNITNTHRLHSRWALRQTTIVVNSLIMRTPYQLWRSASRQQQSSGSGSELVGCLPMADSTAVSSCSVHVLLHDLYLRVHNYEQGKNFSFVGAFLRTHAILTR